MAREYKDSGIEWIGEIPKEWKVLPHKYIMRKKKEIQEHYSGQDIISLTMNGVIVRDLDAGGKMPLSFDGYQVVYPNNLLLCLFDIDVTPRCVGLIKNFGVTSPAYSQFVVKEDGYPPYYDYLLRYMDDNKCLLHLSKNLRSSLTETDFGYIHTCLPPLSEQQKIADYLDKVCGEVDEMIALQEQMIEELKAYKQSVITEAVTKGLNPNVPMKDCGIDWIGEVPEHWIFERLKFLCTIQTGNQDTQDAQQDGEYPFYVRSPKVERSTKYSFDGEGILMAGDGAGAGRVFHHAFGKYAVHQRVYRLSDFSNIVDTNYLFHYVSNLFCKVMDMGSAQSTVPSVRLPMLLNFVVCIPPLSEQQSIASYLDTKCAEIDALIAIKQSKIEELKEYKKSVIYEYVTGKKEVV